VPQHGEAVVVGVVVVPLVAVGVDEEDVVGEGVVVVYDVSINSTLASPKPPFSSCAETYVKYTMLSLPLFFGTVSGASASSTRYIFFSQLGKYSSSHVAFSEAWLATTTAVRRSGSSARC
jgi:hypothetical protein